MKKNVKIINKDNIFKMSLMIIFVLTGVTFIMTGCGKKDKTKEKTATSTDASATDANLADPTTEALTKDADGFYLVDDYVETVGETINVRINPSTDSPIYIMLEPGKVLPRNGYNDQWSRVIIDGSNFYIYSDFVKETSAPAGDLSGNTQVGEKQGDFKEKTIVIDPGNQANLNASTEPVGPNSEETKIGVSIGAVGTSLGTNEYELNLIYASKLKMELEERGYTVTILREDNNVDITNMERAKMANETGATAYLKIKMNYSDNPELSGVMAQIMTSSSPYNSDLYEESNAFATRLIQGVTEQTQANNQGIYETTGMTSINWSQLPVAVIELGYLSNPAEEEKLVSEEYQDKVVTGLANGIDYYYCNSVVEDDNDEGN